jgi:hypothetical protein
MPNYEGSSHIWKKVNKAFARTLFEKIASNVRALMEREEKQLTQHTLPLFNFNPHRSNRSITPSA